MKNEQENILTPDERKKIELLARRAGAELMRYWCSAGTGRSAPALDVAQKGDGSPVTTADLASNAILLEGLREILPHVPIISEETAADPAVGTANSVWIIDPLDGTRSFIEGRDDFSILIALVIDQIARFGLMYFPARKLMAAALYRGGAFLDGARLAADLRTEFRPASVYYRNFTPAPGSHLVTETIDSGMAFLMLARGELDAVIIRMTTHREWDIAAPAVVLEEAGAIISDEEGKALRFNRGRVDFRFVVASNPTLHRKALQLVRE